MTGICDIKSKHLNSGCLNKNREYYMRMLELCDDAPQQYYITMITEHREPNDDEDGDVNEYASSIYSFEKKIKHVHWYDYLQLKYTNL